MMSVVLPAPTGTTARTGFVGQLSALACIVASPNPANATIKYCGFMGLLLLERASGASTID
jgi:hypothetical protein